MPNLGELKADTLFLANTVSTQYKDADLVRNINIAYDEVVLDIWQAVSDWQFDEGIDNLPVGYTNLLANQDNYQLPTNAREIERVEVKNTNGDYVRVSPIDASNIQGSLEQFSNSQGVPRYYDVIGRSVVLYPTPNYEAEHGLMVLMSKSVTPLENPTDEPKIDREFHTLLSLKAALRWSIAKGSTNKRTELEREIIKLERKIKPHFSKRNKDFESKIKPIKSNYE